MTAIARLMLPLMVGVCVVGAVAQTGDVDGLIANLSSDDADLRLSSARELGELGPEPLGQLLVLVAGDDQRVAAGARVAVGVLVHNLVAPGAPEGRKVAARTLLEAATSEGRVGLRRFALRQLAVVGEDDSVPGLRDLLGDPEVAEMARYALARIPGAASLQALAEAVESADTPAKVGLINALGLRGVPAAVRTLATALEDPDPAVRMAAAQAMGQTPATEGIELLLTAMTRGEDDERAVARDAYVRLANTLLAAGQNAEAKQMYARIYADFPSVPERCAGLAGLARASGPAAVPQLIEAVREGPRDVRGVAKYALVEIEDASVTEAVAKAARSGAVEARAALLWVLGERGDETATPALIAALRAPDEAVRVAALDALGKVRDPSSAQPLIDALGDEQQSVRDAAEAALNRIPGEQAAEAIVAAIVSAPDATRVVLVRALGRHPAAASDPTLIEVLDDPNEDVRIAAVDALGRHQAPEAVPGLVAAALSASEKEAGAASAALTGMTRRRATRAILAALETAEAPQRAAMLRALGARDDPDFVELFVDAAQADDEDVVVAALEGLARLHDPDTAAPVLDIARTGSDREKTAAVAAYLEIGKAAAQDDEAAGLAIYHEAFDLAQADGEKRVALEYLATLGDPASLARVQPLLQSGSDEVRKAAAAALVAIGDTLAGTGQSAQAVALLESSIPLLSDRDTIRRAAERMRALGKPLALAAKDGFLTEYWVLGPIGSRDDLRKSDALPTDAPVNVAESVTSGDQTVAWNYRPVDDPIGHLDLEKAAARRNDTGAYAYVEFDTPDAQDVLLKIGSDDDVVCWLNGEKVHEFLDNRGWSADQDTVQARLQAGTNRVLCKVLNGGAQWALSVRITDRDGKPLQVRQWKKTPADIVADRGFITSFWLLGPLPGREAARTTEAVDTAGEIDLMKPVSYGDQELGWRWTALESTNGVLDFERAIARQDDVGCYAYAEVVSEQEQDVLLKIGSDDDVYCWLNGELVHENPVSRPCAVDADVVEANLQEGTNRLLVKVLQGGGQWALSLRITDREGKPLVLEQARP